MVVVAGTEDAAADVVMTGRLGKVRLAMSVYQWDDPCN